MIPALISMAPTMRIRTWYEDGINCAKSGFKYCSQFVRKLIYLSIPAAIGSTTQVYFNKACVKCTEFSFSKVDIIVVFPVPAQLESTAFIKVTIFPSKIAFLIEGKDYVG